MNLTANFTLEELTKSGTAKRKHIDNTPNATITANLTALAKNVLQPLREAFGQSIVVDSGYRCPKLNMAVGGAEGSQHMKGQAADIHTLSDNPKENKKLFDCANNLIKQGKIKVGQLIDEYDYNWVHISTPGTHTNQVLHLKKKSL